MPRPFDNFPEDAAPDDWTVGRLEAGLHVGDPRAEQRKRELDEAYPGQSPQRKPAEEPTRRRPRQRTLGDLLAECIADVPNDNRIASATLSGTVECTPGGPARWGTPTARRRATDYTPTMDVTIVLARGEG